MSAPLCLGEVKPSVQNQAEIRNSESSSDLDSIYNSSTSESLSTSIIDGDSEESSMDQMNQLETAENVSGFDLFIQQGFIIENQHKISLKKLIKQNYQYIIHLK